MTNSVPGLGWPEDAAAEFALADDQVSGDPAADAWLADLARNMENPGTSRFVGGQATGGLPDRYARRADRMGLGWPTGATSENAAPSEAPTRGSTGNGTDLAAAHREHPARPVADVGLGSVSAVEAGEPAPERVRQALASVSRETRGQAGRAEHRPAGPGFRIEPTGPAPAGVRDAGLEPGSASVASPVQEGWVAEFDGPGQGRTGSTGSLAHRGGQASESEVAVVIPAVPDASADTPIARAAQAAVVARSGGETWPRPPSCRIITIANQKGGVGKTTTAVNLAASLAMHGARVLVVDLDPQGNASTALDVEHHSGIRSVYNVLVDGEPLSTVVRPVAGFPHLYCAPAAIDLAGAEIELVPLVAREARLARAVAAYDSSNLDYIFIDCPPSLGLLTVNALVAAPEVLIPIQCEYYALEGLEQLLRTVELVRSHLNPDLAVTTILLTMYDGRTRLASQVADEVRDHFGAVVLGSVIPRSVRVSEAPSYGQSVMTYDPGSTGAVAYLEAARELARRNVQQPAG
jgi:chromosome partitioning protein